MRAYLPAYEMRRPADLKATLALLAREPGVWKPFAGGTDLMVLFEAGQLAHRRFIDISRLQELRGISVSEDAVRLGALTTYSEIRRHPIMQKEFPMLCLAAAETGAIAIQNRGTIGGNIFNASPAADSPPALLAYDATLHLSSMKGAKEVSYAEFHTGYKLFDANKDELLVDVTIPRKSSAPDRQYYRKVGTRKAQAISKICFAGLLWNQGGKISDVRIAMGSVAPVPLRCLKTEAMIRGKTINAETVAQAREALLREIAPIDDIRSDRLYRQKVSANLIEDFLCGTG